MLSYSSLKLNAAVDDCGVFPGLCGHSSFVRGFGFDSRFGELFLSPVCTGGYFPDSMGSLTAQLRLLLCHDPIVFVHHVRTGILCMPWKNLPLPTTKCVDMASNWQKGPFKKTRLGH